MLPRLNPAALAPMLLALVLLLTGCAHTPPSSQPVPPPAIPPLPATARQTDSPGFSAKASSDIERWQQLLTAPSLPAASAPAGMTR